MSYLKRHADGQIHVMRIVAIDDKPHPHSFFELVYVLDGTADHFLNQETLPLKKGDYFIIDPGSVHCYRNTRHFEIVNCLFMPEYIDRALLNCSSLVALLSNQTLRFGVPTDIHTADRTFHDADQTVRRLIRQMEQEYANKQTGYNEQLRCLITQVLVLTVRAAIAAEHPLHPATAATISYLRSNLNRPLCLQALSRHCGYAPQYISNLFRQDTGMTIRSFLQRLRIQEAQKLLKKGLTEPAQLAQAVGYTDIKHFLQLFRCITGNTLKQAIALNGAGGYSLLE